MTAPRYVVGIDLGTTNTVVAYVELAAAGKANAGAGASGAADVRIDVFPVPQVVRAGEVRAEPILPSSIYIPAGPELPKGAIALPWDREPKAAVGAFARDQGAEVPSRLVSSAKSWLCHDGVDRRAAILPWDAPPGEVPKISPLEAQASVLRHVVAAWNGAHPQPAKGKGAQPRLENQEVLLCVPASFDAAARELTLEAARAAGLKSVTLLEEPQAAFYAWLHGQRDAWRTVLAKGDVVLVCDVGGGTSDFSLISVAEEEGNLVLERIAVGEHLILGGDNMDLALAHVLSWRLEGDLDAWQARALWHACRAAKEALFGDPAKDELTVAVGGRGTKLVGGLVKGTLTRKDLDTIVVDGFFPRCEVTDRPARGRQAGFQEIGLPFVADAAVTRHLASFLSRHARPGVAADSGAAGAGANEGAGARFVRPRFVLFNGGVMKADVLRERVRSLLGAWTGDEVLDLGGADLDLAVARGAAYYGLVRRGHGIRIRGGAARSYYIGIESAMPAVPGLVAPLKALCVVPFGMEEGTEVELPGREFALRTGETAEFRFLGSTTRKADRPGDLLERVPDDMTELAPIETTLEADAGPAGRHESVPVTLKARLTEVGTLDLFCVRKGGKKQWKLEYNVREAADE